MNIHEIGWAPHSDSCRKEERFKMLAGGTLLLRGWEKKKKESKGNRRSNQFGLEDRLESVACLMTREGRVSGSRGRSSEWNAADRSCEKRAKNRDFIGDPMRAVWVERWAENLWGGGTEDFSKTTLSKGLPYMWAKKWCGSWRGFVRLRTFFFLYIRNKTACVFTTCRTW